MQYKRFYRRTELGRVTNWSAVEEGESRGAFSVTLPGYLCRAGFTADRYPCARNFSDNPVPSRYLR
jgi:hypothetical protein